MIRQKLQQNLKQQKGKVFPLSPPATVPSCTAFKQPHTLLLVSPFPRSQLGLGSTACVSLADTVLEKSTRTHAPEPLSREERNVICSRRSWPRETSSWHGIELGALLLKGPSNSMPTLPPLVDSRKMCQKQILAECREDYMNER